MSSADVLGGAEFRKKFEPEGSEKQGRLQSRIEIRSIVFGIPVSTKGETRDLKLSQARLMEDSLGGGSCPLHYHVRAS